MGAAREKDSADFDLEQFIDLFDEALTSTDPRVKQALGHLMTITALIASNKHSRTEGPLRRLFDDMRNIINRIERLESGQPQPFLPGFGPVPPTLPMVRPAPTTVPNTVPGSWPWHPGPIITCGPAEDVLKDPNYRGSSIGGGS